MTTYSVSVVPRVSEKAAVREALDVIAGLSVADVARRLGVSASAIYAVRDPARHNTLGPKRLARLAGIYRAEAARLLAAAAHLEEVASTSARP